MATVAAPADLLDVTTTDALQEKKKLRKHFARFDIVFFLICTLVGVDTLGAVASNGPQAFTWLIFMAILFFVPYALLTAELGTAFPEEGGPYIWTRLAFGRRVAAVNGLIYWVSNPIWVGGTLGITALAAIETFFNQGNSLPGAKILGGATLVDTTRGNAIMTAIDQAGTKVARYRIIGSQLRWNKVNWVEITVHPGQPLTDELLSLFQLDLG
jgi:amino acid transporter